ncbi:MAG: hypothetical protein QOH31_652 [Verrucomicrobiota bacterium]|jgi:hypothetical protein
MNALLHRKSPSVEIRNLSSEAELDWVISNSLREVF